MDNSSLTLMAMDAKQHSRAGSRYLAMTSQQQWAKDYRADVGRQALNNIARNSTSQEDYYTKLFEYGKSMGNTDLGGATGKGLASLASDSLYQIKQRKLQDAAEQMQRERDNDERDQMAYNKETRAFGKDMLARQRKSLSNQPSTGGDYRVSGL